MYEVEEYIALFRDRISDEPRWIPCSVSKSLLGILGLEGTGVFRVSKQIQSSLNAYIYRIAKAYTPQLSKLTMEGKDCYVFGIAKVFPIHTLEWVLAVMEFAFQHAPELGWLHRVMIAKTTRMLKYNYSEEIANMFLTTIDSTAEGKAGSWNRSLYSMIEDHIERLEYDSSVVIRDEELEDITSMLFSIARSPWGTRDSINLRQSLCVGQGESSRTRSSMILLSMIKTISTKTKR